MPENLLLLKVVRFLSYNTISYKIIFQCLGEKIEQFSWSTFISPFNWMIWLCLLCISFLGSTALWVFHRYPRNQDNLSFFESLCITFSSIFCLGIKDANDIASNASERLTLLIIFTCGSLFFYTYCGFLTSSLAIPNDKMPFNSPEGILKTNYR